MLAVAGMAVWAQPWDFVIGSVNVMEQYLVHECIFLQVSRTRAPEVTKPL